VFGIFRLIINDSFVNLIVILIKVGRKAYNKLVKKSPDAINVRSSVMTLAK
jgi:predicted ABC-type exoprotein transport system permease subunit